MRVTGYGMIGTIVAWMINLVHGIGNIWRRIARRRVDYVWLEIGGALPEFAAAPSWWQRRFLGMSAPVSLYGLRRQLDRIAADPQTTGELLRINELTAG